MGNKISFTLMNVTSFCSHPALVRMDLDLSKTEQRTECVCVVFITVLSLIKCRGDSPKTVVSENSLW